jgi:DNA repair exonuclease SbcCD ATPase subunit
MIFEKIRWKNLFSYGKTWTEIPLNSNKSVNIVGENGEGKSVLIEAVFFALTGKPFRKCNKGQIVNIYNKKNCLVELTAIGGKHSYLIRRGAKPNVFQIFKDGASEPLDEAAMMLDTQTYLETVLGFNKKNLKHTLIMSATDYVPFLRLKAEDKRLFIDDILSIEIFTLMSKLVKSKLSILKDEIRDNATDIDKLQYKLNMILEYNKQQQKTNDDEIAGLKRDIEDEEKSLADEIKSIERRADREKSLEDAGHQTDLESIKSKSAANIKNEKEKLKAELTVLKGNAAELKKTMADLKAQEQTLAGQLDDSKDTIQTLKEERSVHAGAAEQNTLKFEADWAKYETGKKKGEAAQIKVNHEINSAEGDLEYYTQTDECTECGQQINSEFKQKQLDDIATDLKKLQLKAAKIKSELNKVENFRRKLERFKADQITPLEDRCRELDAEISKLKTTQRSIETDIKVRAEKEIAQRKAMDILKGTSENVKKGAAARIAVFEDIEAIKADLIHKYENRIAMRAEQFDTSTKHCIGLSERRIDGYQQKIKALSSEEKGKMKDEDGPRQELSAAEQAKKDLAFKKRVHDTAIAILSDKGIKTYIIKRYMPKLTALANQYLEILSASYKISFDDNLDERILLKGYDKLSYNNFSEGERQRCDVALLFAFLDIGKMKNSITSNLLLMDEVFDRSLDGEGIRGIIDIVESLKGKGYTIINITHKLQLADQFDITYRAKKDKFSSLNKQ